jgi:Spy/CpxP family protein refolding chaperone
MIQKRTWWTLAALVALLTAWTAAPLAAQGPGGPGRGPRGFGRGGMQFSATDLVMIPQVAKEIELVDDQRASLEKLAEESREQMRGMFEGLRDLSEEERRQKFEEMREKMEASREELTKKVEEVLLPHQRDRLKEISIQIRGTAALDDKAVAESLGISDEQKEKITAARDESREKSRELFEAARAEGGGGEREAMREKMESLRKETDEKILAVLSDDQRAKFDQLKGKAFEFDRSQLFRPPGGGRGRRGGPPGGAPPADGGST